MYGIPFALVCGALYTLRGGGISHIIPSAGTQLARMVWCLPIAIAICLVTKDWCVIVTSMGLFAGLMIPHGVFQNRSLYDYIGMTLVGFARWFCVAVLLAPFYPTVTLALLLAYLTHGIGYAVGYAIYGSWFEKLVNEVMYNVAFWTKYKFNWSGVWWSWPEVACGFLFGLTFYNMLG